MKKLPNTVVYEMIQRYRGQDPEVYDIFDAFCRINSISKQNKLRFKKHTRDLPAKTTKRMFKNGERTRLVKLYVLLRPIIKRRYLQLQKETGRTSEIYQRRI